MSDIIRYLSFFVWPTSLSKALIVLTCFLGDDSQAFESGFWSPHKRDPTLTPEFSSWSHRDKFQPRLGENGIEWFPLNTEQ